MYSIDAFIRVKINYICGSLCWLTGGFKVRKTSYAISNSRTATKTKPENSAYQALTFMILVVSNSSTDKTTTEWATRWHYHFLQACVRCSQWTIHLGIKQWQQLSYSQRRRHLMEDEPPPYLITHYKLLCCYSKLLFVCQAQSLSCVRCTNIIEWIEWQDSLLEVKL